MRKGVILWITVALSVFAAGCAGEKQAVLAAGGTRTPASDAVAAGSDACPLHRGRRTPGPNERDATPAEREKTLAFLRGSPTGRTVVDQLSMSVRDADASRRGFTRLSHDPQHGTQVTFSAADGRIYLWYPGNPAVLQGQWRACEDRFGIGISGAGTTTISFGKVCFRYGADTFNPATGAKGDAWECAPASKLEATLIERRQGDIFGLASQAGIPFVLGREKTTIDALLARKQGGKR